MGVAMATHPPPRQRPRRARRPPKRRRLPTNLSLIGHTCGEIKNTADMNRVIQEEWERLAFDDSQYEEDGWIGINNGYVDKWKDILEEE